MTLTALTKRFKASSTDLSKSHYNVTYFLFYSLNIDQRHFPMLREYEKAKLQMMNQDIINTDGEATGDEKSIGDKIASMNNTGMSSKSPYNNFTRATTG